MIEARHDPVAQRFVPDPEVVAVAHNFVLDSETPPQRFMRQRYEEAGGALRVALDALREVYPGEMPAMDQFITRTFAAALHYVETALCELGEMEVEVLGDAMVDVLHGKITTVEEFRDQWGPFLR